ncbi:hypothetical protein VSX61_08695 [Brenneria populi subsp. brevivirga]|uniref:hypothetical protein n=1 Tax=Brenneria populi TaxID=1505588 RepID=UPI002E182160|nr:hypothetical protein [Brenneria populi subsp. brevivirga]
MIPTTRRNWKRIQPSGLRNALELCKDHARARLNRSVEQVADLMGLSDHWTLYKWLQNGRMPANLIRPYEAACGIDYVTRWIAASGGKLLIDIPTGRALQATDVSELHGSFADAMKLLTDFYAGRATQDNTVQALTNHLQSVAWHHGNVNAHSNPQLELEQ